MLCNIRLNHMDMDAYKKDFERLFCLKKEKCFINPLYATYN